MDEGSQQHAARVRALNDAFRKTFVGGAVLLTEGVRALAPDAVRQVLKEIRAFDKFDDGNDPYREHDFVNIEVQGHEFFGKIDYYNLNMDAGSEDPADQSKTRRILTIMRAEEY